MMETRKPGTLSSGIAAADGKVYEDEVKPAATLVLEVASR
jgi:hypothetical protein